MGWCAEFACNINASCECRMVAGKRSCTCDACGAVCTGRYAGCKDVWLAGPTRSRGTRPPLPGRYGALERRPLDDLSAASPAGEVADAKVVAELLTAVHDLRLEMRTVLTMLSQQQAILALLVDDRRASGPTQAPPPPAPPPPSSSRPGPSPATSIRPGSTIERAIDALLPPSFPLTVASGTPPPTAAENPRPAAEGRG